MSTESRFRDLRWWLEVFVFVNLAFLALDIYVAHSMNEFGEWEEWIPFFFSLGAPLLLIPGIVKNEFESGFARIGGVFVGASAILVGVAGMVFHLESHFFLEATLHSLVYAAPFVAPLAYTGLGFLVLLNRMESGLDWARWVTFMAFGGFVGNFVLSLLDHAQNGFFYLTEWIPVAAAAFGVSFLGLAIFKTASEHLRKAGMAVMAGEIAVGALGFYLHASAIFDNVGASIWNKIVFGAPIFAPLLFANLALLGLLGLYGMSREVSTERKSV